MDRLHISVALGPLAVYLLYLAWINLRRRPALAVGVFDWGRLALGLSGMVVVGPMELFMPRLAAGHFGPYAWLVLLAMYGLAVMLVLLAMRPRLIVYNLSFEQARRVVGSLALEIDAEARWAGDSLLLPQLGVQFFLEPFPAMRNVSLVAAGPRQALSGWNALRTALRQKLTEVETARNPRGYSLLGFGLLMIAAIAWKIGADPQQLAEQFREMMRL